MSQRSRRTGDAHGRLAPELKICLLGKVELRNIAVPQIYSFQLPLKNRTRDFANMGTKPRRRYLSLLLGQKFRETKQNPRWRPHEK